MLRTTLHHSRSSLPDFQTREAPLASLSGMWEKRQSRVVSEEVSVSMERDQDPRREHYRSAKESLLFQEHFSPWLGPQDSGLICNHFMRCQLRIFRGASSSRKGPCHMLCSITRHIGMIWECGSLTSPILIALGKN